MSASRPLSFPVQSLYQVSNSALTMVVGMAVIFIAASHKDADSRGTGSPNLDSRKLADLSLK